MKSSSNFSSEHDLQHFLVLRHFNLHTLYKRIKHQISQHLVGNKVLKYYSMTKKLVLCLRKIIKFLVIETRGTSKLFLCFSHAK
jgi:hypothetical protein